MYQRRVLSSNGFHLTDVGQVHALSWKVGRHLPHRRLLISASWLQWLAFVLLAHSSKEISVQRTLKMYLTSSAGLGQDCRGVVTARSILAVTDYGTPRPQSPSRCKDLAGLSATAFPGRACLYQGREKRSSPINHLPWIPDTSTIVKVRFGPAPDHVAAVRHMNPYRSARFAPPFRPFPFLFW